MNGYQSTDTLVQTWVHVVDQDGRAHLEARWVAPEAPAPAQTPHAA